MWRERHCNLSETRTFSRHHRRERRFCFKRAEEIGKRKPYRNRRVVRPEKRPATVFERPTVHSIRYVYQRCPRRAFGRYRKRVRSLLSTR